MARSGSSAPCCAVAALPTVFSPVCVKEVLRPQGDAMGWLLLGTGMEALPAAGGSSRDFTQLRLVGIPGTASWSTPQGCSQWLISGG